MGWKRSGTTPCPTRLSLPRTARAAHRLAEAEAKETFKKGHEHQDKWLGCDICSAWFMVDSSTYARWRGCTFICSNLRERCMSRTSPPVSCSRSSVERVEETQHCMTSRLT